MTPTKELGIRRNSKLPGLIWRRVKAAKTGSPRHAGNKICGLATTREENGYSPRFVIDRMTRYHPLTQRDDQMYRKNELKDANKCFRPAHTND